ncbi:MAG: hypothetical protein ACO3C4_01615 [Candidatus Limnocylindrus sp.]
MATAKGGYRLASGEKVPSVTTVLKFKDPGPLVQWAYKQGREHGYREGRGEPAPSSLYEQQDKILSIGTAVHEMCEVYVKGGDPKKHLSTIAPADDPTWLSSVMSGYGAFESWVAQSKLEIVDCEVVVISEEYRYAGTLDFLGRLNGKLVLGDFKTSNSVYAEYLAQMAAYAQAYTETTGNVIDGGYHLLRFAKENGDFAHHFYPDLADGLDLFLSFRRAYDVMEKLKKRAA